MRHPFRLAILSTILATTLLHGAMAENTIVKPGESIAAAVVASRGTTGPKTIILAPGRHFLQEHLLLDDRDSGLTLRGKDAELYGGIAVTGWVKWKDNIWRAPVPKDKPFYNLIVDGKPAVMAQTPNIGSGFGGGAKIINNGAIGVPQEWRGYDFTDAQVSAFIGGDWFSEMRAPTGFDASTGVLSVDPGQGAQFGGMNNRFVVRGVLELLDEPGEWCLKSKQGFVYFWPESGTPENHVIVRPTAEKLIEVHGRTPQSPAKNISIEDLSLVGSDFCRSWHLFAPGQDGSTPARFQQGLVFGENVEGLKVSRCRILAAGHSGVWLNKYASNCVIESCLISGAGFAGIYSNGFMPGEGPFKSGLESHVNKGHRFENNYIYDCGKLIGGGCGIQLYQCGDTVIDRNRISDMPRYGISYKGIRWGIFPKNPYGAEVTFDTHFDYLHTRNLRITGNEIHSVCRNSFDFGGIECWSPGRDNLWEGNDLHDIDQTLQWDGWAHVLFPDDASHWLTMRNNIIHHCHGGASTGAFMMKSLNQVIEKNLVADCNIGRVVSLNAYIEPGGNYTIRRNVFASDGAISRYATDEAVFTGYAGTMGKLPPDVGGIKQVDFNMISPRDPAKPNTLAERGVDVHSVFGDPKLIRKSEDWNLTCRDYALADDSPARKLGFQDINDNLMGLRPDFPFDISAFTRLGATRKIQAENYQRMRGLRTNAGTGIYHTSAGSWAKYDNIDFGKGVKKAIFSLDTALGQTNQTVFVRRYGDTVVEALPFKGDQSVETIARWEISKPYQREGKNGPALFDESFDPEVNIVTGDWKALLEPVQTRAGVRGELGTVDFDAAHGEGLANSCAYARASFHAQTERTNATMTVACGGGVKVWLNGKIVITSDQPGTFSETKKGIIKAGWNTVLVKINQDATPSGTRQSGLGNFWFKFGTVTSSCGEVVALPGLPTEERGKVADTADILEVRLDSPKGPVIGTLKSCDTSCPITGASGIRSVFLVFPSDRTRSLDWFRFE